MAEIRIEGRRVAWFECGSGPAIVLLHAGGSSGKQWAKTARLLEGRFRVIAPDLASHSGTPQACFTGSPPAPSPMTGS